VVVKESVFLRRPLIDERVGVALGDEPLTPDLATDMHPYHCVQPWTHIAACHTDAFNEYGGHGWRNEDLALAAVLYPTWGAITDRSMPPMNGLQQVLNDEIIPVEKRMVPSHVVGVNNGGVWFDRR
jgi:hypothetical protein